VPHPRRHNSDKVEGWLNEQEGPSLMLSGQKSKSAPSVQSFREFAKTYVPRRRRQSNFSSIASTPNFTPVAILGVQKDGKLTSAKRAEPETQAWNFDIGGVEEQSYID
jgi:hypothetical protein